MYVGAGPHLIVMIALIIVIFVAAWLATLIKPPGSTESTGPSTELLTEEQQLLSSVINAEATPNDTLDMYLIGSTIINRVQHKIFPNSTEEVIFEPRQYQSIDRLSRSWLSDKVAVDILNCIGVTPDIIYFYNPKYATDKKFLNFLDKNCVVVVESNSHIFLKRIK